MDGVVFAGPESFVLSKVVSWLVYFDPSWSNFTGRLFFLLAIAMIEAVDPSWLVYLVLSWSNLLMFGTFINHFSGWCVSFRFLLRSLLRWRASQLSHGRRMLPPTFICHIPDLKLFTALAVCWSRGSLCRFCGIRELVLSKGIGGFQKNLPLCAYRKSL
jgi:hypothetical protein